VTCLENPDGPGRGRPGPVISAPSELLARRRLCLRASSLTSPAPYAAGRQRWVVIDWDSVATGALEWELAYNLHTIVGLWPDTERSQADTLRRLRAFAAAYGMGDER